jgi:transcriptional regulator with PAS, ATPase and Fis domain
MLVGDSTVMQGLRATVARVGATEFTALVEGESGVGKELVARALHDASPRRRGPFVAVNCAALVETLLEAELFGIEERTATGVRGRRGKFEQAEGGTLFLDEVADLSLLAQAKLLRVLQDMSVERVGGSHPRAVNTRVLAATNRRLSQQVLAGAFREDLFYRLSGVEIEVPPLRSRREDIPVLVEHLLHRHRHTRVLTASAAALEDLPALITRQYRDVLKGAPAGPDTLRAWSSRYVRLVLDQCEGNKTRACRRLDISYHTLRSHLQFAAGAPQGDARTP